jgi:hypothetical protein
MTQAVNLANFANNLDSSGGVAPSALNAPVPVSKGGTNAATVSAARTSLGVDYPTLINLMYPVGSIYSSTVSTNPGTLFGTGTWVAYAAGRVLIGDGGGFSAGSTGGSADATLVNHSHTYSATSSQDGGHYHGTGSYGNNNGVWFYGNYYQSGPTGSGTFWNGSGGGGPGGQSQPISGNTVTSYAINDNTTGTHAHSISGTTNSQGASSTGANLQPYVVVYMWQRTA